MRSTGVLESDVEGSRTDRQGRDAHCAGARSVPVFLIYRAPPSSCVRSLLSFGLTVRILSQVAAGKVSRSLFTVHVYFIYYLPRKAATVTVTTVPPLTLPRVPSAFSNRALKLPRALEEATRVLPPSPTLLASSWASRLYLYYMMVSPNSQMMNARSMADDLFTPSRATRDKLPRRCRQSPYYSHLRTTAYTNLFPTYDWPSTRN